MNNKLFELEQEIQKCWGITSDISDYIWRQYDSVEGPMSDDE